MSSGEAAGGATSVLPVHVEFGHCDPAGIVWYPNFYEWFDAASHRLAERAGVGLHALRARGYLGLPLMQTGATYRRPVRFGDDVEVRSTVVSAERRSFRVEHRIVRDGETMLEGFEVRFLGEPHPDDPQRLRAAELPDWFRASLGVG
ncbi:MAG TPA: acyl-CoA thioesterase [Burkholderiaceae bacterium]|nr:acyl-CoA thioesterase [Burkholderiaceae bacterium]